MWEKCWDAIFQQSDWGKYPPEELVRFISQQYGKRVPRGTVKMLEVGSGTGANLWYLAREGFDVTGIDGSSIGVDKSLKRLKAERLRAKVEVGDVVAMPFEDGSFDCVVDNVCICTNSYKDSQKILKEIHRVLAPGGKLFSKTLMTGTSGDGNGEKLKGEDNTYVEIYEGVSEKRKGLIRFMDEKEIPDLYRDFTIESIDYSIRSTSNRKHVLKEWVIVCVKK